MMQIINNQDRNILSEGRSNNMGFAFCKVLNGDDYETIQPISPCKDYLNDVIFAENTDKPISAHGLHLKGKQGLFEGELAYMAIAMCPYKYDNTYNKKELVEDIAKLAKYHKHLEYFINYFEEILGIDAKLNTIITEVSDNLYLKNDIFYSSINTDRTTNVLILNKFTCKEILNKTKDVKSSVPIDSLYDGIKKYIPDIKIYDLFPHICYSPINYMTDIQNYKR